MQHDRAYIVVRAIPKSMKKGDFRSTEFYFMQKHPSIVNPTDSGCLLYIQIFRQETRQQTLAAE